MQMYKNFLTHQLALGFDRACGSLDLADQKEKNELRRCSRSMVHYLNRTLYEKDEKEISKHLYVTLTYLRDCKEIFDRLTIDSFEVIGRFEVLHGRIEQMCQEAAKAEGGQLRMLG